MSKKLFKFSSVFLLLMMAGCMGSDSDTVSDPIFESDDSLPFTDAYIVYPGPHERWSGPETFTIHISTRGSDHARVSISSGIFKTESSARNTVRADSQNMTIQAAREEIGLLYAALKPKAQALQGCLSPVRVKLIRSDGALIERQACRGELGWPKVASEIVNHFIASSVSPESGSRKIAGKSE